MIGTLWLFSVELLDNRAILIQCGIIAIVYDAEENPKSIKLCESESKMNDVGNRT